MFNSFPLCLFLPKSACGTHFPSVFAVVYGFYFAILPLKAKFLQPCVWKHSELPLRATLSSFYFPPSLPSVSPPSFSFSLTAEQLGRLTAQRSAHRSSPLTFHKLIFYSLTVTPTDSSFHTCLTHTLRDSLIFFQIFRCPSKCWFVL